MSQSQRSAMPTKTRRARRTRKLDPVIVALCVGAVVLVLIVLGLVELIGNDVLVGVDVN